MVPLGESHTAIVSISAHGNIPLLHTLLELELLDTLLIGGDGGALDTDRVLLDGLGGIHCDLVVGLITVLETLRPLASFVAQKQKIVRTKS